MSELEKFAYEIKKECRQKGSMVCWNGCANRTRKNKCYKDVSNRYPKEDWFKPRIVLTHLIHDKNEG